MKRVLNVLLLIIYGIIGFQAIEKIVTKKRRKYTTVPRKSGI